MTFVVVARWTARPGEAARVREVIATMTPLSQAEPGNLGYEDHKASPHFRRHVLGHALAHLAGRSVTTYESLPG